MEDVIKNFIGQALLSSRRKKPESKSKIINVESSSGSDSDSSFDDYIDSDEEFYKESHINTANDPFTHELEREELKWLKRAEWLEEKL